MKTGSKTLSSHSKLESKYKTESTTLTHSYDIILNFLSDVLDIRRLAGIPDFISGDDMDEMICSGRLDPKVVFAYVQEVYRALKDN